MARDIMDLTAGQKTADTLRGLLEAYENQTDHVLEWARFNDRYYKHSFLG